MVRVDRGWWKVDNYDTYIGGAHLEVLRMCNCLFFLGRCSTATHLARERRGEGERGG